jgi:hypothetical protein
MPGLGPLADDITAAIMREVEEYAQPGDDAAGRAVHRLAHEAVAGFGARVAPASPGSACKSRPGRATGTRRRSPSSGRRSSGTWMSSRLPARPGTPGGGGSSWRPPCAGDANAAARRLHVDPQTIRYRLRQVSELFDEALHLPDDRFRLLLALRVRGLLGG